MGWGKVSCCKLLLVEAAVCQSQSVLLLLLVRPSLLACTCNLCLCFCLCVLLLACLYLLAFVSTCTWLSVSAWHLWICFCLYVLLLPCFHLLLLFYNWTCLSCLLQQKLALSLVNCPTRFSSLLLLFTTQMTEKYSTLSRRRDTRSLPPPYKVPAAAIRGPMWRRDTRSLGTKKNPKIWGLGHL